MNPGAVVALAAAAVILQVWVALGFSRMLEKLGESPTRAWVPVANIVLIYRLGIHRLTTRWGYGAGMTVVGAVALPVWTSILGFGSAVPAVDTERALPIPASAYVSLGVPQGAAPVAPAWLVSPPAPPESTRWMVQTDDDDIDVVRPIAVLGRKPTADHAAGNAQLLSIPDTTKTVSKTHARIALVDGVWSITDLHSTNGVHVIAPDGQNLRLVPGVPAQLYEAFRLGDMMLRIRKEG